MHREHAVLLPICITQTLQVHKEHASAMKSLEKLHVKEKAAQQKAEAKVAKLEKAFREANDKVDKNNKKVCTKPYSFVKHKYLAKRGRVYGVLCRNSHRLGPWECRTLIP